MQDGMEGVRRASDAERLAVQVLQLTRRATALWGTQICSRLGLRSLRAGARTHAGSRTHALLRSCNPSWSAGALEHGHGLPSPRRPCSPLVTLSMACEYAQHSQCQHRAGRVCVHVLSAAMGAELYLIRVPAGQGYVLV